MIKYSCCSSKAPRGRYVEKTEILIFYAGASINFDFMSLDMNDVVWPTDNNAKEKKALSYQEVILMIWSLEMKEYLQSISSVFPVCFLGIIFCCHIVCRCFSLTNCNVFIRYRWYFHLRYTNSYLYFACMFLDFFQYNSTSLFLTHCTCMI